MTIATTWLEKVAKTRSGATILFLFLAAASCRAATSDRAILDDWFACVECTNGELDSLRNLAAQVPGTVDTLGEALLQGPSTLQRSQLAQQLQASYQLMAHYVADDPSADSLGFSQSEFVDKYLAKMVTIYQERAARGLGEIGGHRARAVLDSALQLPPSSFPPAVWA